MADPDFIYPQDHRLDQGYAIRISHTIRYVFAPTFATVWGGQCPPQTREAHRLIPDFPGLRTGNAPITISFNSSLALIPLRKNTGMPAITPRCDSMHLSDTPFWCTNRHRNEVISQSFSTCHLGRYRSCESPDNFDQFLSFISDQFIDIPRHQLGERVHFCSGAKPARGRRVFSKHTPYFYCSSQRTILIWILKTLESMFR